MKDCKRSEIYKRNIEMEKKALENELKRLRSRTPQNLSQALYREGVLWEKIDQQSAEIKGGKPMNNCSVCGKEEPKTVYGTSALSSCCNKLFCDGCLIDHYSETHPDRDIQSNPDLAERISKWTD